MIVWVRQYSAPNAVGARKLKALIFYTTNRLLYKSGHFAFLSPSLGDLGAMYAVHLAHWKGLSGLLCVMVDKLRGKIDWKSPFLKGVGHFS